MTIRELIEELQYADNLDTTIVIKIKDKVYELGRGTYITKHQHIPALNETLSYRLCVKNKKTEAIEGIRENDILI